MEELRQKLVDICNESGLPLEAVLFVIKDLLHEVQDLLRQMKEQQKLELKEDK